MSLLHAPLWIQAALAAEALAVLWLTGRFGWRGLAAGVAASLAFWFLFGLFASYLVSRLEGGGAATLRDLWPGAVLGSFRLGQASWPLLAVAAAAGGLLRWRAARRKTGRR